MDVWEWEAGKWLKFMPERAMVLEVAATWKFISLHVLSQQMNECPVFMSHMSIAIQPSHKANDAQALHNCLPPCL